MNETLVYYDRNASSYFKQTIAVEMKTAAECFLKYLPEGARILDFGCGSGRDSKFFLERGFQVDAVDGSKKLAKLASEYTGLSVKCMLFQELEDIDQYDGIWSCASLLHLPKAELPDVLAKMWRALHPEGILYLSMKEGIGESLENGRYYAYYQKEELTVLLQENRFTVLAAERTEDEMGRSGTCWINVIARRTES